MICAKPVSCKKCNKEILPGTAFYDVDHAPKCTDCCIADGTKLSPVTAQKGVTCQKCNKEIPVGAPFYEVEQEPKCLDCCIADGAKPSPVTESKPVCATFGFLN
ncbi:hypothetical protein OSTOST_19391, partial [Ostertagia ostertagi]